jgi:hypothetical protein
MPQKSTGRGTKHLNQASSRRLVGDYTSADERAEAWARKRAMRACDRLLALLAEHHPEQIEARGRRIEGAAVTQGGSLVRLAVGNTSR